MKRKTRAKYLPGEKKCKGCGAEISTRKMWCDQCSAERQRQRVNRAYHARKCYTPPTHPCVICGDPITQHNQVYCSDRCKAEARYRREAKRHPQPGDYACGPVDSMPRGWNMDSKRGYDISEWLMASEMESVACL